MLRTRTTTTRALARLFASAAVLAVFGCQDGAPVEPHAPAAPPAAQPAQPSTSLLDPLGGVLRTVTGLVSCRPLPPASTTATIGWGGGTISVGPHVLTIPRGALWHDVTITASIPFDQVNRVHFEPHGLEFHQPATLSMSYANCGLVTWLLPHHIAYVDGNLNILELLSGTLNLWHQSINADIGHFSDYAIAW